MADERRLAAIMFTDIVGYSKMTQRSESLALELLKEHNEILRPIFFKFRGREIKTIGDAFLVEFTNVLEAVQCAVECQRVLFERNQTANPERKLEIRIGVHVGDVVYRDNDVFGDGVNIAARVQPLAEPGGICISEDVARQIQNKLEIPVAGLGASELKNIKLAVAIFKVLLPWKQKKLSVAERVKVTVGNKQFRRIALALAAAVVVLFLVFKFEFLKIGSGSVIKLNPNMTFKPYQIPFKQINSVSMSKDGNWVAFEAADKNNRWDIFVMDTKGSNVKRVTNDSAFSFSANIDISPDGSRILVEHFSTKKQKRELIVVPFLGGEARLISDSNSANAQWSPDGKRIGFQGYRPHGRSFETFDPEKSDYKTEFLDTAFTVSIGFCWSPDGKSIAWLRGFEHEYQEIIIHNLETGEERKITSQKATIWDLKWNEKDLIIYSTNVSGQYNLWAVSAKGGEPVQITKGGGPDLSIGLSSNGKKIVYLQNANTASLWTAHIDGSGARQLTSDDMTYFNPAYSPDKSKIAFHSDNPDPAVSGTNIYMMDKDGGNLQQLTSKDASYTPYWSPDGKKIGYSTRFTEGVFRVISSYVEVQKPNKPVMIGEGELSAWFDNDHVIINDFFKYHESYLVSLSDTSKRTHFFKDSIFVWAKADKKTIFYYDFRTDATLALRVPENASTLDVLTGKVTVKPILISKSWTMGFPDLNFVLYLKRGFPGVLWSKTIDGHEKKLGEFPNFSAPSMDISNDGKDFVYCVFRISAKLYLVENLY